MTVTYISSGPFKSLFIWRGSIAKAVVWHTLAYFTLFYVIMVVNQCILSHDDQVYTKKLFHEFDKGSGYIPITFLLGFFVAAVVASWWEQFNWISFPDTLMSHVMVHLPGKSLLPYRRLVARWSNLQAAIAWRMRSTRSLRRFPTMEHLITANLMTREEYDIYNGINDKGYGKWWLPTYWTIRLLQHLYTNGKIDTVQQKRLFKKVCSYRDGFAMLQVYEWVKIPLVYVQVIAIATYGYFLLLLFGRQPDALQPHPCILYVPTFTLLEFLFYIGWLKVGQQYMDPFGDDDDDFEMNWILDHNVSVTRILADGDGCEADVDADILAEVEALRRDGRLPHTRASKRIKDIAPKDRLDGLKFTDDDMVVVRPPPPADA